MKDHYKAKHTGEHIASDLVSEHTSILLTLGLMKMTHDRAIQLGNGGLLMTLYKWMMLWFDRNDMSNYSTGLLELQYQLKVLPDYLTHAIVWNRFVNTKGKADSNIPMGKKNLQLSSMLTTCTFCVSRVRVHSVNE